MDSKTKKTVPPSGKRKQRKRNKNKKQKKGKEVKLSVGENLAPNQVRRTPKPTGLPLPAPGVVNTIPVVAVMCSEARQTWSCAIISRIAQLSTDNLDQVYYVYQTMDNDFVKVVTSSIPFVNNRLSFVNTLFELLKAKTVNTPRLNVSYQFDSTTLSGSPSPQISIRGQNYYMYNPGVDDDTQLTIMVIPPTVTNDQALVSYNNAIPVMTGNTSKKMLQQQAIEEASQVFSHDGSAYAQGAQYVSSVGSCTSGGYRTAESEVFCKSLTILSSFVQLPQLPLRVAHDIEFASMDVCGAFGLPYLDEFKMLDYSTKLAPIIKYIDLSQLWTVWVSWFVEMVRKAWDSPQNQATLFQLVSAPIPLVYAVIAFRQSIVKYFAPWQAITQFQGYQYAPNGNFEGLRMGTNTVSRIPIPLQFPLLLAENCRALAGKRYCAQGLKAEKMCQWYLPCIGLFEDSTFYNPTVEFGTEIADIFDPTVPSTAAGLNYIDGNSNLGVRDFNSNIVQDTIYNINKIVELCSAYSGATCYPEGSSDFNLLAFTRYDEEVPIELTESMLDVKPRWQANGVYQTVRREIQRNKSISKDKDKKGKVSSSQSEYVWRPKTSVFSMQPRAYSSAVVITKEIMSILQTLVVPSVLAYADTFTPTVTQSGFQSAFTEPQSYKVNNPNPTAPSILQTIVAIFQLVGNNCAPGLAAKPTMEVARTLQVLQESGRGGFLDAALCGLLTFAERMVL